jgi:DNA/RNA endonuclease YhcR with UshA esterase domain
VKVKNKAINWLLAVTVAFPLPTMVFGVNAVHAEGPNDPAPFINAKVVNENAGKKVLFDNSHGNTAGAADWVIDGGFSDFGNALANNGFYVKELRKSTPITYDDLKDYDVFVTAEAQYPYKPSEQDALLQYVQNGGSIFFIADHYNADRNKNRWDGSEVYNGFRRGAWADPAKGMNTEERNSAQMQGVVSSDWLGKNFGVRFRYNALGNITANHIVAPNQAFGITTGVSTVAMHAGSTVAILDPKKAKGVVYLPTTNSSWASAVDQGVYNGGGVAEGPFAAVSKVGLGKAAFLGDSSPVEDASPKYLREENGSRKTTYDGFKEQNDGTFLVNTVKWLANKESYTSLDQVQGLQLDQPTPLLAIEAPETSTEPQAEPWAAPAAGYKWYDPSTFKAGSYGATGTVTPTPDPNPNPTPTPAPPGTAYSFVHQTQLPNAQEFQVRVTADNLVPNSTVADYNIGLYLTGGAQVGQFNIDGVWSPSGMTYNYSNNFTMTADALGHAYKDITVRVKPGTTGAANLRLRQVKNNIKTEAVTFANVPAEPLPADKPPMPAKISISAARAAAAGTYVTVEGVVTTLPGIFGSQGFYLQDATGGMYVFQSNSGISVGDTVKTTAKVDVFNDEVELTSPLALEKTGTAELPAPVVATEVNDENQGQLVTLQDVTIANLKSASPAGSFEFDAVAGDNSTRVRVDVRTGLNQTGFPYHDGQRLTSVTGVASIFKGTFQLKPRGLSDFAADTIAPVTEATVSGQANENGWFNQDITVTLTATDNGAVDHTEYQVTDGIWNVYSGPITISTEGTTNLVFRSVDNSGNVEADKTLTLQLDKTAPTVALTQSGTAVHDVSIDGNVSFGLTATDAHSGVASQDLYLDGNKINAGTEISALSLGLGVHMITAKATDNAGNVTRESYLFEINTSFAATKVLLNNFAAGGEVTNNGIATSIEAKLNTAQGQFEKGNSAQAEKHLKDLLTSLKDDAAKGKISANAGDVLTGNINYLLAHGLK